MITRAEVKEELNKNYDLELEWLFDKIFDDIEKEAKKAEQLADGLDEIFVKNQDILENGCTMSELDDNLVEINTKIADLQCLVPKLVESKNSN